MKKYLIILQIFILVVLLNSCDDGNLIVDFKITVLPDKLVYLQNGTEQIDLRGGMIEIKTAQGSMSQYKMTDIQVTKVDYSNVDISKEGLYYVKIYIHNGKYQEFPIVIVSKGRLQELLNTAQ
jgi:hypothetical protein